MTARAVRVVVIVVCGLGVAGMIVSSILKHNGAALTFGLITATAVLCLMVATAVTGPATPRSPATRPPADGRTHPTDPDSEELAAKVEERIVGLVAAGADEASIRDLVREAVVLGRRRQAERTVR